MGVTVNLTVCSLDLVGSFDVSCKGLVAGTELDSVNNCFTTRFFATATDDFGVTNGVLKANSSFNLTVAHLVAMLPLAPTSFQRMTL